MSNDFKNHREKRISEMSERLRNSRVKKKEEVKFFSQRVNKAQKNIDEIKSN